MKAVDRGLKSCAAKDLFRQTLQTLLEITRNVGNDVLIGDLLLFHQNQRFRLIRRRQKPAHTPDGRPNQKKWKQNPPPPSDRDGPILIPAPKYRFV